MIGVDLVAAGIVLRRQERKQTLTRRPLALVRHKADHRAAMDRRQESVEQDQAVAMEENVDVLQIVIEQVLVIDLIKSQVIDDLLHVEELDDEDAVFGQAFTNAFGDGMELLQVEEDSSRVDARRTLRPMPLATF